MGIPRQLSPTSCLSSLSSRWLFDFQHLRRVPGRGPSRESKRRPLTSCSFHFGSICCFRATGGVFALWGCWVVKSRQSFAAGGRRGGLYAAIGQFLASSYRAPGSLFERTIEHEHRRDRPFGPCVVYGRFRRNHLERLLLSERLACTLARAAGRVRRFPGGDAASGVFPWWRRGRLHRNVLGHHHAGDSWFYRRKYD